MKKIIQYIILTAVRDWLFLGLLLAILGVFGISNLLGYTALVEESAIQTTIFAGICRLILIIGMVVFICFRISQSFENKEIPFILAKNISREKFVFSYWLGFNIVAQLLLIPVIIIMLIFSKMNMFGALQWFVSVSFELMIMTTFTIAISLIIKSSVFSVFVCFAFYTISRMMNFFTNSKVSMIENQYLSKMMEISQYILNYISSIIPRLDLFGQTRWLTYGRDKETMIIICAQLLIYVPLLFLVAFYDFDKKQF